MSLPELLVKAIPAFMESARSLRKEISNPQGFDVRFRYFLALIASELEVILSGRTLEPNEQALLEEVAELLDHLVQEKVVSVIDACQGQQTRQRSSHQCISLHLMLLLSFHGYIQRQLLLTNSLRRRILLIVIIQGCPFSRTYHTLHDPFDSVRMRATRNIFCDEFAAVLMV